MSTEERDGSHPLPPALHGRLMRILRRIRSMAQQQDVQRLQAIAEVLALDQRAEPKELAQQIAIELVATVHTRHAMDSLSRKLEPLLKEEF